MLEIFISIASIIVGTLFMMVGLAILSAKRAYNNKPTGHTTGMYFNSKSGKLVGTKTDIHRDPKTGSYFEGETKEFK